MAFSPAALRNLFRRDTVQDPFGGDDMYDGESRFAGKGPKIALAASGLLFVALIGGVVAVVMTQEETAPPVLGSLSDLEVVEDTESAPTAAAPEAHGPAVVADSTAATDRSIERRPWLATTPQAPAAPAAKPAAVTPPAPAAKPAVAAVTPPPAPAAHAEAKPAEVTPADAKPAAVAAVTPPPAPAAHAEAKPAEAAHAPAAAPAAKPAAVAAVTPPAATMPAAAAPAAGHGPANLEPKLVSIPPAAATPGAGPKSIMPEPAEAPLDPARDIAGIPALRAAEEAPGAPRRFDAPAGDAGPAVAGGRPRLVEPPLPPTDKIAVAAPPPRYANLTDIKADAVAAAPGANATKVAFIVDGLGLSATATDAAINKLPAAVTLAFSPYTRGLKMWVDKAKAKGHEVLIEVPMESKQFPAEDPGPLGLLTSLEAKDNQERLDSILKDATGAVGIYDDMGSKFRESSEHINTVFAKLKTANLFYVQGTQGMRTGEPGVPTATADVVVDERPFRAAIDARLDYTERLAKYQGSAIAALSAKPVSYERLVLWLAQAQKKGIVLTPVSQVLIK